MGSKLHTKRQLPTVSRLFRTPKVTFLLIFIFFTLKLELCDSLSDTCYICQNYAFETKHSDVFTGIPRFNELVSSISYEYLYDIVENFIKKQDEVVESNLINLKNDVEMMFAPVESFFGKTPNSIETMNNRLQKFVECIKNKSQNNIRDSLENIKNSTLTTIVSDFDDLANKIKIAENVSFTNLGDVFGKAKCYSMFTDVQKCCSLKYITSTSTESIEAIIASNPSLDLKKCGDFETISNKFAELEEALIKQETEICA
ncbi:conserved hypothetical protein [Theileria orientalis strain Shintoku]|uniref:Uncharacterized protein n=1 Tax=Theileria orientalis strain Shintoku TaxID=869250 RepID=J4D7U7_THEOR|nr:conserved hypothetical protein [Theileria orientalis strain Shintoku]PVC51013.1 hypothetical protein MACL_00001873 [Theileria orientalis]BAM40375.1 conserved hypothetical protein [Theileria orientalis strain Shintoku]|eukprot:XP_009690676.1 conserved hypothetical protein [Theileria orientalis strain Shintoku]